MATSWGCHEVRWHTGQVRDCGRGAGSGWLMLPMVPCMDFAAAFNAMREHDQRVTREGWNGEGMWLAIQWPGEDSKMRRPYIYMSPEDGGLVPWDSSQTDLFATDWQIVP